MTDVEHAAAPNGNLSSPPSPQSESKATRKREREVSLEPVTTPSSSALSATVPAKNKRRLDSTEEGEESSSSSQSSARSASRTPPPTSAPALLPTSPGGEMKIRVRQISQGVEDLNWRNKKATSDTVQTPGKDGVEVDDPMHSAAATASTATPKSPLQDELHPEADDTEQEKSLKRKFLERGTSQGPPENGVDKRPRDDPGDSQAIADTTETPADDNPRGKKRSTPPPPNASKAEATKRQRDDTDGDDNPRETKRPSPPPPPETHKRTPSASAGGFMAYASNTSPFATVKGQNIFKSSSSSPSPATSASVSKAASPPPLSTPAKSPFASDSSAATTPAKRTGFEAFASSASPFASVAKSSTSAFGAGSQFGGAGAGAARSKSPFAPATLNAFSAYTGQGAQGFALPPANRASAKSPVAEVVGQTDQGTSSDEQNGHGGSGSEKAGSGGETKKKSFGERLRETREEEGDAREEEEEEPKLNLTEQEVTTGEEDEHTISQVRGKLYTLADGAAWKERGTGVLRLNVRASDGGGPRLVMRKDAVYTLLLNATLFKGMRVELAQDPRYVRFSAIEDGATVHYNLRLANAKIAAEFIEEVHANIPSESEPV